MSDTIYIRPIEPKDALVSYKWRNNPKIWRFTGARPDKYITPEMEMEWLVNAIKREDEKRFAICLTSDDTYIGNVFFTDIKDNMAQMHIFIGDLQYWGGGRAYHAICQVFDYGFKEMNLDAIYVQINAKNTASLALSKQTGFKKMAEYYDESRGMMLEKMIFTQEMHKQNEHLKHNSNNSNSEQRVF